MMPSTLDQSAYPLTARLSGRAFGLASTKPPVDQGLLHELFDYDEVTGVFRWRCDRTSGAQSRIAHVRAGGIAGSPNPGDGYRYIGIGRVLYAAHRLAWTRADGLHPSGEVDHINGNRDDNALKNLRDVPRSMNAQNVRHARRDSSSGLAGVFKSPNGCKLPFTSSIRHDGKLLYLGLFATDIEAHNAFISAKRHLHPGCTV